MHSFPRQQRLTPSHLVAPHPHKLREKTLVGRERARAGYGVLPYLLSKLAAELPIGRGASEGQVD